MNYEKIIKFFVILLAIVIVLAFPTYNTKQGTIIFLSGTVEIIDKDNVSRNAEIKSIVKENEKIKTGRDSRATIQIRKTGVISLLQNTEAYFSTIMKSDEETIVELEYGQVFSKILRQERTILHSVKSPTTTAVGQEVQFLTELQNGITSISVYKGNLTMTIKKNPEKEIEVKEGERVVVTNYQRTSNYVISNLKMLELENLSLYTYIDRIEDKSKEDIINIYNSLKPEEKKVAIKVWLLQEEIEVFTNLSPLDKLRKMGKPLTSFYLKDGSQVTGSIYSQTPSAVILDTGNSFKKILRSEIFGSEPAE